ncbi:helix-turn-helix domain-containing protein [Dactylosporangium sp. CA-139066]|uniref:helix-turn-helix domain-containing protein n=1 Tax=Dactylosporangium sp. CA-139066 TaxID=3239930 RepID=UPI003D944F1F
MEKLLLTAAEAAEVLNVGRSTVYDLIRLQLLKSVKLGRSRRIPAVACQELVARLLEMPDGWEKQHG